MNRKKIGLLLLIAWMILIFVFSQQPGDVSDQNSKLAIYIFDFLGLDLSSAFGELANFIVRKAAHFTVYFVLFILYLNVFKERTSFRKALIYSIIGVFLYACTDEFHQSFIPGRGPAVRDVIIDTAGGLTALTVIYVRSILKALPM